MTNEERLAWIEANSYLYPTSIADLRWLIAEVRRLTDENESACEKIKELGVMLENANTAIGTWKGEYARGRAEERKQIVKWIKLAYGSLADWMVQRIKRGEHVEATDAK